MPRLLKIGAGIVVLTVFIGGGAGFVLSRRQATPTPVPIAPRAEPTETVAPTFTATASPSVTPFPTPPYTPSPKATDTPTLATLVLQVTAVNPDVTLDAPPIPSAIRVTPVPPTVAVPSPAALLSFIPTGDASPVVGWLRYGVADPAITQVGQWNMYTDTYRSADHRYLYTDAAGATLSLRFLGAAARVRYARLSSYGVFEVRIDGQVVTTVDAYLPKSARNGDFVTTDVFALSNSWHTLEIRRLDRRNPASTGGFVAIDAVDVYQNGALPTAAPTSLPETPTFTPSPAPIQKLQVLIAPPTIPPTVTPAPPQLIAVSLMVAYDLNGDKAVEPGEGIADLPVQLVTADTNRVVASGSTDAQGYIRLETTGTAPLRLVVPYFNRFWDVPLRASGTQITLLIPPANRPALIP